MQCSKRQFLSLTSIGAAAFMFGCGKDAKAKTRFEVTLSDSEWKKRLSPAAYRVLRQEDTERPYTSALNKEKRKGTFVCAGCDKRLFSSTTKYDSGTGWPSFWQPLSGGVGTKTDFKIGLPRTEVHCARCSKPGPTPTRRTAAQAIRHATMPSRMDGQVR